MNKFREIYLVLAMSFNCFTPLNAKNCEKFYNTQVVEKASSKKSRYATAKLQEWSFKLLVAKKRYLGIGWGIGAIAVIAVGLYVNCVRRYSHEWDGKMGESERKTVKQCKFPLWMRVGTGIVSCYAGGLFSLLACEKFLEAKKIKQKYLEKS